MTASEFAAWLAAMRASRRWSGRECARQLGCSPTQITTWQRRDPPLYIGYACAALAYGLPTWRKP